MTTLFESARLRYRGFRKSDLDILYDLFNDPEIQLGANDHYVIPRPESFKDMLEQWTSNLLFCVIVEKETERFVGQCGLRYEGLGEKNRDATVGLALQKKFWGNGYGKEAVEWMVQMGIKTLGLHRISLDVFASNQRAVAVYKKCGFLQEGVRRKALWRQGKWEDVMNMAILDEDYWTQHPLQ